MNYSEMSDHEIDIEVAKKLGINWYLRPSDNRNNVGIWVYGENDDGKTAIELPNYCNSWADIGPIIEKYGIEISLMFSGDWCASRISKYTYDSAPIYSNDEQFSDENPKRAAAIVFLMIEVE